MGAGRYPDEASDDAAETGAEEATLADEEWPVAEQYRVEPPEQPPEQPVDDGTVVIQQVPSSEPTPVRRFPPDLGPGLLAALLGVLLLLLLIPAGLWLAARPDDDTEATAGTETLGTTTQPTTTTEPPPTTVPAATTVPDVTGRTLPQARELLENAELRSRFRRVDSDRPPNEVVSQSPRAGAEAEPRSFVALTVSGGPARIAVPDVRGMSANEATSALREAGLRSRTRAVPSDEAEGTVLEQSPAAGEEVTPRTVVALQIAEPTTVRVPNLVGMRAADARSRLRSLGLGSTQRPVESPRPAGEVVSQSPGAGAELREGGTVTLRVSTGPASVAVPDVVGLSEAAATRDLEAAGFVVQVVDEPTVEPAEDGTVLAQSPPAGASRREGSTVTITVARLS